MLKESVLKSSTRREVPRNESKKFLRSGTLGGSSCPFAIDKENGQSLDTNIVNITADSLNLWLTKFALHYVLLVCLVS